MKLTILESASYVALITVCVLGGVRLWQYKPQSTIPIVGAHSEAPTSVAGRLPIDLSTRKKWLVLALSTQCRYCIESAPFHHDLLRMSQNSDIGIVAVFPQSQEQVEEYEATQKVAFPKIVAGFSLDQLEIRGTPTLLVVDQNGNVLKHWFGLLSDAGKKSLTSELGLNTTLEARK